MVEFENGGQFSYRATGVLGDKRETMLKNELHARPPLARPLIRGYSFPEGTVFGRQTVQRDGGVQEAMHHDYAPHSASFVFKTGGRKSEAQRDFLNLNKGAVLDGCVTAHDNTIYRNHHDFKRKAQRDVANQSEGFRPRRVPPNMTFGKPTRPPTPLWDLIEHKYQDRWIDEHRQADRRRRVAAEKKTLPMKPYATRSSMLRQFEVPAPEKPLWKLSQFDRKAEARIETFRSRREKADATAYDDHEKIIRQGVNHHHGIIELPKF